MTVDQAQQLREAVLEVRDRLGIPEGHFAIDARLDVPAPTDPRKARLDSLSLRMPL